LASPSAVPLRVLEAIALAESGRTYDGTRRPWPWTVNFGGPGFWNTTNLQDWHVCELSQLGVSSRAYTPGPYAQAEGLLWQFDQEYLRALGDERP